MNDERNEEYYKRLINKKRRFVINLGYQNADGSPKLSFFGGKIAAVHSDRLIVLDEKLCDFVSLKFDQIISDIPMEAGI